ncbi:MAG: phage recombination protein Bet [Methanomicrobiaceae archaeon]|nr:phage recombination protein Bet [Methanomicrobiaceae archaeon]
MSEKTPADTASEEGVAVQELSAEKLQLIKNICAKDCTDNEFQLLMHLAKTYGLDPLARQIWAVKYPGSPAQIFCGRDGLLVIAHRSEVFDGMESGVRKEDEEFIGWARVFRKDMSKPFYREVYGSEYNTGKALWKSKPRTMIQKVAEAQALRLAFSITGMYSQEEMDDVKPSGTYHDPNACSVCGGLVEMHLQEKIRAETDGKTMCLACFNKWWEDKKNAEASADIPEGFTAEVKPVEPEPAPEEKPAEEDPEPEPVEVPAEEPAAPANLTNRKCEDCGELVTKEDSSLSQYHHGAGHFLCKPCFDKRREEQKKKAQAKKSEPAPAPAPEKAAAPKAQETTESTGIVCEICGAKDVSPSVAQMAYNFTGKRLCQKCMIDYKKGGAE